MFRTIYSNIHLDLVNRAPWVLGIVYKPLVLHRRAIVH